MCLVSAVLVAGCSPGPVEVDSPTLSGADARACTGLIGALPDRVDDEDRAEVDPVDGYAAAWDADAPIVLTCGVPEPAGFDRFATCQVVNGVGWFIPDAQVQRGPGPITMTTVGRAQNVEVRLAAEHWPPANAMVDLSAAIEQTLREVEPCV